MIPMSRGSAFRGDQRGMQCTFRNEELLNYESHGFRIAKRGDRSQLLRGGSWLDKNSSFFRCTTRDLDRSTSGDDDFGFRVARRKP